MPVSSPADLLREAENRHESTICHCKHTRGPRAGDRPDQRSGHCWYNRAVSTEWAGGRLSDVVVARIRGVLPERGDRILASLHTAVKFARLAAAGDDQGVRWAESCAYNLREALDSVVTDTVPGPGRVEAMGAEWARYELVKDSVAEEPAARDALFEVLRRLVQDAARETMRDRQLLKYLRDRSAADPLTGPLDPVAEYNSLRSKVSSALHTSCDIAEVGEWLDRALSWFTLMFTPPDAQAGTVIALAAEPFTDERMAELKAQVASPHLLLIFFANLVDPAWLTALHEAGLAPLPREDQPWPVWGLSSGLGRSAPEAVADLLDRLLSSPLRDENDEAVLHYEVLKIASRLGPSGYRVVGEVLRRSGDSNRAVRSIGGHVAMEAEPQADIVEVAARVLVGPERWRRRDWGALELLGRVVEGMSPVNARRRMRFLGGKFREAAAEPHAGYTGDIASLRAPVGRSQELIVVLGHYIVSAVDRCREEGVGTPTILEWLKELPGAMGERIHSQILVTADDVDMTEKVAHGQARWRGV